MGFVGADAIAFEPAGSHPGVALPCVRTIARILARHGLLNAHRLVRVEVHIATLSLRFFRLRRKAPDRQPLIKQLKLKGSIRLA